MDNWENINAVQRMQSYIETHLHEPITLRELANAAGYSPWHAAKLFKNLTGKSPFEYIAHQTGDSPSRFLQILPSTDIHAFYQSPDGVLVGQGVRVAAGERVAA